MVKHLKGIEVWPIDRLAPYDRNARTHTESQIDQLAASIEEFGMVGAIVARGGVIAKGHGTLAAIRKLYADGSRIYPPPGQAEGAEPFPNGTVPVLDASGWTDVQFRAFVIADNRLALDAGWDADLLEQELRALEDDGFDLSLLGFGEDELASLLRSGGGDGLLDENPVSLSDRFLIPPFSVLNAREGWWQDRKRAWLALGIQSEIGRDAPAGGGKHPTPNYKAAKEAGESTRGDGNMSGTSVFDPVICEIAYRWFCPSGGTVLDPFAGGSVRGIIASKLGLQYIGQDLREIQVQANRVQADAICADDAKPPAWIVGDSRNIDKTCADVAADLVFTCPPYADLEVYSDDPADLSAMKYADFRAAYAEIIAKACARLSANRFACIVVGEVRDKKGNYIDFVGDTVQAFRDAGLHYYNEAILVTAVGSLPIRAGASFSTSRKLGKTHQNVLVFVKGNGKEAASACGQVDVAMPEGVALEGVAVQDPAQKYGEVM